MLNMAQIRAFGESKQPADEEQEIKPRQTKTNSPKKSKKIIRKVKKQSPKRQTQLNQGLNNNDTSQMLASNATVLSQNVLKTHNNDNKTGGTTETTLSSHFEIASNNNDDNNSIQHSNNPMFSDNKKLRSDLQKALKLCQKFKQQASDYKKQRDAAQDEIKKQRDAAQDEIKKLKYEFETKEIQQIDHENIKKENANLKEQLQSTLFIFFCFSFQFFYVCCFVCLLL